MFVKIENGVLITAKTVHTPMGVFNSDSAEAPDGWSIVADTEVSPADEMDNNGVPQIFTARQARRALNAPFSTATDGIVLSAGQSITNSYDTPQNSYIRAMGHEITVSVITE